MFNKISEAFLKVMDGRELNKFLDYAEEQQKWITKKKLGM